MNNLKEIPADGAAGLKQDRKAGYASGVHGFTAPVTACSAAFLLLSVV